MHPLVPDLLALCGQAADAILSVYSQPGSWLVETKADESPVTNADRAAHQVLCAGLQNLTPDCPVISEEAELPPFEQRRYWPRYWLIDPLDGTKEFLARNGEFAINLALIEQQRAVLGVIYAPVSRTAYWGAPGAGAYCRRDGRTETISTRRTSSGETLAMLYSRRYRDQRLGQFLQVLEPLAGPVRQVALGSALKLGVLAAGDADFYPRFGTTFEWDTAAGQAIVEAAGGAVWDWQGQPLRYNTKADPRNPDFIAVADPSLWQGLLQRM